MGDIVKINHGKITEEMSMQRLVQWVAGTASSTYQSVKNVVSATFEVISVTASIFSSESFRTGLVNWLTQSWDGFTRALNPMHVVSLLGRPKTARAWLTANASGLLRAAPIIVYRYAGRPIASAGIRSVSANPWVETAALSALDAAAFMVMMRNAVKNFADTRVNNANIAKASADETRSDVLTDNPMMKSCGHDVQDSVKADVKSAAHFYGSWIALSMIASAIPYGEAVTLPLKMLLIGRSFVEYPLSAAGNCEKDRLAVLNKNNPYAFGVGAAYVASEAFWQHAIENTPYALYNGASYLMPGECWQALLDSYTGTSGRFIGQVLTSMLTLHFIMAANLSRQTPLPGTKPGLDCFKATRKVTDVLVGQTATYISEQFNGPVEGDWYQEAKKDIQKKLDLPAVQTLRRLFVDESFQDWDKVVERPAVKLLLELYGDSVLDVIGGIKKERARQDYQQIHNVHQWANKKEENEYYFKKAAKSAVNFFIGQVASKEDIRALDWLLQKELEKPLNDWQAYILKHSRAAVVTKLGEYELMENYGAEADVPNEVRKPGFYHLEEAQKVSVNALPCPRQPPMLVRRVGRPQPPQRAPERPYAEARRSGSR